MKGISLTYTKIQFSLLLIFFLLDIVWIKVGSFTFYYNKNELLYEALFLFSLSVPYVLYKTFRPDPNIVSLLQSFFFLFSYIPIMLVLSYLVTTLNQPLVDPILAFFDRYVGLDAPTFVVWVQTEKLVYIILVVFYNTFALQFPLIILYLSFLGETIRLERFLMQFMIAAPLTALIAGLFPAIGPSAWYPYPSNPEILSAFNHIIELRHNILDMTKTDGVFFFPSFHTVMACLYVYVFKDRRKAIFIPILLMNAGLIFSCIPIGQHYVLDIVGGMVLFIITVAIEQFIFSALKKNEQQAGVRIKFSKKQCLKET